MMDPSIGWYQPEFKGQSLSLWSKLWKDFNNDSDDKKSDKKEENNSIAFKMLRSSSLSKDNPWSIYDLEANHHLIIKHNGTPWIKSSDILYENIEGLNQEIEDFFEYIKPKPMENLIRVSVQQRIIGVIEHLWPRAVVECFGSFKTDTYLPTSDIDLVVINHQWPYLPLAELEQQLITTGQCLTQDIRVLDRATVPIIKMTDFWTGIRINISFNMPQVVKSVNLVKEYLKEFPNATKLLFVIKQFVLQRDFNEVFRGGLSSYSLVLMVVHFFKTNPDTMVEPEKCNLGHLLMKFLDLYGRSLNYESVGLKVKEGIFAKKSEMLITLESCHDSRHPPSLLCIEDPLDSTNNVSKNSYKVDKIRDAFRYAFEILDKAVGPNRLTVGKTQTILGRIIRITDEVIDKREGLLRSFSNLRVVHEPFYNPYRMTRGNNNYNRNYNNRGKRNNRWTWNNNHRFNNQNRHNNPQQPQQQQNGYTSSENSHPHNSNGQKFQNINYNRRNGFKRNDQNNGMNGHHNYHNNNKSFNQNFSNVCYYSYDRNHNQHREKVQHLQQLEQKRSVANDVFDGTPTNGSTNVASNGNSRQRNRSNTCD